MYIIHQKEKKTHDRHIYSFLVISNRIHNLIKIQSFIILSYEHLTAARSWSCAEDFVISISGNVTIQ